MHHRLQTRQRPGGFTLVEILIVVLILGILGAIVVPQFGMAATEAKTVNLQVNIQRIRNQLEYYAEQHGGMYPDLATFADQMTKPTDPSGAVGAVKGAAFPLGPYLMEMPVNPRNGLDTVTNGAPGGSGWYYDPNTGEFLANDSAESRDEF